MGFFSDLKDDLSQAVNELMPEEGAEEGKKNLSERERRMTAMPDNRSSYGERPAAGAGFGGSLEADLDQMLGKAEQVPEAVVEEPVAAAPAQPDYGQEEEPIFAAPPMEEKLSEMGTQHARRNTDEVSVLTESMLINGNIATEGSLEVRGSVVGNVEALGKLNITGMIQGNSQAAEIYADGAKITGELRSNSSIKIGQSTVILGNIYANSAVVAGAIKGDIDVKGPVILDASAIVMGDIKSKSVQINNGAVIEGMCSQCYADVNPTSFFDSLKNK